MQRKPLIIYGEGQQTRDFLYVSDLVEAILLADKKNTPGEVFQIASGRETSILKLIEEMKRVLPEIKMDIRFEPARTGEISEITRVLKKPAVCWDLILRRNWKTGFGIPGNGFSRKTLFPRRDASDEV